MNMKKIIVLMLCMFLFTACGEKSSSPEKKITESRFLFGTYIQMIVYSENEKEAHEAVNAAFDRIGEIDSKYNSKTRGSVIYNLNNSEKKEAVLDEEGVMLFQEVGRVYKLSHGKYDITISPLLETWGFYSDGRENIPSREELDKALKQIDFSKVELKNNIIKINEPIKEIDTGSFLKGYAVEEAKKVLAEKGIKNAFVSSVSSISTIGGKPDGTPWKIGIQNPDVSNEILGVAEVEGRALGISGDYQIYVEINGKKYHHIMDKETGYPIDNRKLVVVVCDSAFLADMYSTAFFSMTAEEIFDFAEKENIEVMIVDNSNKVKMTKSFHLK